MSQIATHLRFALALREDLGVLDLEKFVAGAVYPDTRYLSGVERRLTHNLDAFTNRKQLTDFEKGWLAHLACDRIFREVTEDKFADLILCEDPAERWPILNAIKIVQDIEDFRSFDIQSLLGYLDYYEIHFHEDERQVIGYHRIIRDLYQGKTKLTVEDCLRMWQELGMSRAHLALVKKRIIGLYEDEKLIGNINGNFADGMELYATRYREKLRELAGPAIG